MNVKRTAFGLASMLLLTSPVLYANNGLHNGQNLGIAYTFQFLNDSGQTKVDSAGTTFFYGTPSASLDTSLLYSSQYFGIYPLYYIGGVTPFTGTFTNTKNHSVQVTVTITANLLLPPGTLGSSLMSPQVIVLNLTKGQTVNFGGQISLAGPLPAGLDIVNVELTGRDPDENGDLHSNSHSGNNGDDVHNGDKHQRIASFYEIFCPPPAN